MDATANVMHVGMITLSSLAQSAAIDTHVRDGYLAAGLLALALLLGLGVLGVVALIKPSNIFPIGLTIVALLMGLAVVGVLGLLHAVDGSTVSGLMGAVIGAAVAVGAGVSARTTDARPNEPGSPGQAQVSDPGAGGS